MDKKKANPKTMFGYDVTGTFLDSKSEGINWVDTAKYAGAGLSILGSFLDASDIKKQGELNATALEQQAEMLDLARDQANKKQVINVRALKGRGRKVRAKQAEGYISGGVKLKGSALDVMANTALQFIEAEQISWQEHGYGQMVKGRQASIYRTQAAQTREQAKKAANRAKIAGFVNLATTAAKGGIG